MPVIIPIKRTDIPDIFQPKYILHDWNYPELSARIKCQFMFISIESETKIIRKRDTQYFRVPIISANNVRYSESIMRK